MISEKPLKYGWDKIPDFLTDILNIVTSFSKLNMELDFAAGSVTPAFLKTSSLLMIST